MEKNCSYVSKILLKLRSPFCDYFCDSTNLQYIPAVSFQKEVPTISEDRTYPQDDQLLYLSICKVVVLVNANFNFVNYFIYLHVMYWYTCY